MDLTDEERALILKHRKAKRPAWTPRALESYTPEEKIAHFDKEYGEALRLLREKETKGFVNEDEDHWAYEARMNLLGEGFWNYWNGLEK